MIKKIVSSFYIPFYIQQNIFFRPCTDCSSAQGIWRAAAEKEARSSRHVPVRLFAPEFEMAKEVICCVNGDFYRCTQLRMTLVIIRECCIASERNDRFLLAG